MSDNQSEVCFFVEIHALAPFPAPAFPAWIM